MPKQTYLHTDASFETIYKNKENIIDLYTEVNKLKGSSDATIEDLEKLLGNYSQDVTGELDTTKSVIENLSIVASNLQSALNRIDANEIAIARILKDGVGNYIGTYQATDNNDSSNLPFPSADKDRAITEYVTGDTYKYQEWQFNNGNDDSWSKLGMELDSHIHSNSGIPLGYEEKEITITPAIYGWKELTTNDEFDVSKDYQLHYSNQTIKVTYKHRQSLGFGLNEPTNTAINIYSLSVLNSDVISKQVDVSYISIDDNKTIYGKPTKYSFTKLEVWDIITPAITKIALVKK